MDTEPDVAAHTNCMARRTVYTEQYVVNQWQMAVNKTTQAGDIAPTTNRKKI